MRMKEKEVSTRTRGEVESRQIDKRVTCGAAGAKKSYTNDDKDGRSWGLVEGREENSKSRVCN